MDGGNPCSDALLQKHHLQQLRLMDCLAAAGLRPVTYRSVSVERKAVLNKLVHMQGFYPPADPEFAAKWELETGGRWLWRAALREPWSPAAHTRFPPAFRVAARTLLLVAHRGSAAAAGQQGGSAAGVAVAAQELTSGVRTRSQARRRGRAGQGAPTADSPAGAVLLATLPHAVLLGIVAQAAYPLSAYLLSAWRPLLEGGEYMQCCEDLKREKYESLRLYMAGE